MSETVEIVIDLSPTHWEDRFPGARVYINNILIFGSLIAKPVTVSWTGELDDGENTISIEMYNKKDGDTVLDGDTIVNDVLLNIDSISLDGIELDSLLWSKSRYIPTETDAPTEVTDCVNLGWNGVWQLTFDSPIYIWLLENL